MTTVAVMMSVYNGDKYIKEQVDSIMAQKGVSVDLYIRDDGSDETSRDVIASLKEIYNNIFITHGRNLGIKDSFLTLVKDVPDTYEYYAFSDADDVWLPNKLQRAVSMLLKGKSKCAQAYCSQISLVDAELNFLGYGRRLNRPISLSNALVECRMSGATAVFNRELILIAKSLDYSDAVMHDAWMNLLAAAFGEVTFDPESHILYRQHSSNADGGRRSLIRVWRDRMRRSSLSRRFARQAEALMKQAHNDLDESKKSLLARFISYNQQRASAFKFIRDPEIFYQRPASKIFATVLMLLTCPLPDPAA